MTASDIAVECVVCRSHSFQARADGDDIVLICDDCGEENTLEDALGRAEHDE